MDIDLSNASEGQSYNFSFRLDGAEDLFGERLVRFETPVLVDGVYIRLDDSVAVTAIIDATVVFNCDLCLTEVVKKLSVKVGEVFLRASDERDGEDGYFFDGKTLSLDGMLNEKFMLSFPEYVRCKKDCKGLCPICGCDLNINKCNCEEKDDESGSPFAALKDFSSGGKNGSTKKKNF
ncbi:MAG: DUF177 domain-containing protein [Clostridiales bacterium]|jgi:uncharacterized protein|nr:DUF177 domain-containing protein [Clostridiales bacterium]